MSTERDSKPTYQVILQGRSFCDLIFRGLESMPRLGEDIDSQDFDITPGGGFNVAFGLHRLGVRVGWATDFGTDLFSQFVLQQARVAGLDPAFFRQHPYPVCNFSAVLSYPTDRAFVSYRERVEPQPLTPLIVTHHPTFLMFMQLKHDATFRDVARAAQQCGVSILMDGQAAGSTLEDPNVRKTLQAIQVLTLNASEACQLTGMSSVPQALTALSAFTPTVVIKMGAEGAVAQSGGKSVYVPALKVEVIDTTGAGDCFNSGFLYATLRGYSLRDCVRCGNICGGNAVSSPGSRAALEASELERQRQVTPE
jgi:sugar/nucleoside kinase (ribokinase family)